MVVKQGHKNEYNVATYLHWKTQVETAETFLKDYHDKGGKIERRYRDDDRVPGEDSRYNILYSNTETLQPVIYSRPPKADVRAEDPSEVSNRYAAGMLETTLNYFVENGNLNQAANSSALDFLLSGTGIIRPKYKSTRAAEEIENEEGEAESIERVIFERIDFEYVHWSDLIYPNAPRWEQLPWLAFRTYMTRAEVTEQFGAQKAAMLQYTPIKTDKDKDSYSKYDKKKGILVAEIYEIWDKENRQQVFYAEGKTEAPLEINDDPLELEDFFPVPEPMRSITTNGTIVPVPFYMMYQDQAQELDEVTTRITRLVESMRRRGFYDASIGELANITNLSDNDFYPIQNWTEYSGKGGVNGAIDVEDISSYASTLTVLVEYRAQLLEQIYQVIGISDIRRAQTDPRETLGAQRLKSRYGTIRVSTYQRKVANHLRDVLRIAGEIIINTFGAETLSIVTGLPLQTSIQQDEQGNVVSSEVGTLDLLPLLRDQEPSSVVVDIESDSTIIEDTEEQRQLAREALTALTEFAAVSPQLTGVLGLKATAELLEGIVQQFKLGRDIQQSVEDHIQQILTQGVPEQPSPEEIVAQSELQQAQIRAQTEMQKAQINAQIEIAKLVEQRELNQVKAAQAGVKLDIEQQEANLKVLEQIQKQLAFEAEAANPTDNAIVGA